MVLSEVIERQDSFPEEHVIYAARINGQWESNSSVFVLEEPEDGNLKQVFDGIEVEYLLDVFLAQEAVEVWRKWSGQTHPSIDERLRAILYYANHDAFLPVET